MLSWEQVHEHTRTKCARHTVWQILGCSRFPDLALIHGVLCIRRHFFRARVPRRDFRASDDAPGVSIPKFVRYFSRFPGETTHELLSKREPWKEASQCIHHTDPDAQQRTTRLARMCTFGTYQDGC